MLTTSTAELIAKGIVLGLGAAVPIGPVNVEIARRTLRQGWKYGVAIGGGATTVDMTYAVVASIGWAPLIGNPAVVYVLGTAGVLVLLYLSAMCFKGVWQSIGPRKNAMDEAIAASEIANGTTVKKTYVTGLLMTFFNPMTLAFWFVVLPALASKLTENPRQDLPFLCAGVFIGAFGWAVSFSGVLAFLGRFKRGLWVIVADAAGGVVLLAFAVLAASKLIMRR